MAIRGLSNVRRCPRLGFVRLGIKVPVKGKPDVMRPKELEYFLLDPQTGDEQRNKQLKDKFKELYGEQPTAIKIMFPPVSPDIFNQQWFKRYGKTTLLKCKGDNETATCALPEFAEGLEVIGVNEMGLTQVKCRGPECPYQKDKSCHRIGTLQILLPDLPCIGVFQINTGSWNSIVNLNSSLDWLMGLCGRHSMIPLTLRRMPQDIMYEGKRSKHYIMQIDVENVSISQLQKTALVAPEKSLVEVLPAPDEGKDELLYSGVVEGENGEVERIPKPEKTITGKVTEEKSEVKAIAEKPEVKAIAEKPEVEKAKKVFKAKVIEEKPVPVDDIDRFPEKDRVKAAYLNEKIKEGREKAGEDGFKRCIESCGWKKLQEIVKIEDLSKLLNILLAYIEEYKKEKSEKED